MNIDTPVAQMSTGKLYPGLRLGKWCCSGAMKAGVPHFSCSSLPLG
eukprot:CAMPEP_0171070646 /NCGR_PEP_ID=MMETSP0766_2-20121228/9874_1 /TAXON_ID=439317 /ORGANISM="Gambierdiscus australes, Strain CAWD 149" /LENGTH=45 /DNA_ID= /DNA_START= /DNA_END= /DNA_ORIENTATION=